MGLVKKILNRNFNKIYEDLVRLEWLFVTEPEKKDNFVIDLMADREKQFDYLSFLSLFSDNFSKENPKRAEKKKKMAEKQEHQKEFLQIKILSFNKL